MAGRTPKSAPIGPTDFAVLLADGKARIEAAQTRAVVAVNANCASVQHRVHRCPCSRMTRDRFTRGLGVV